jgi:hypothetical protein
MLLLPTPPTETPSEPALERSPVRRLLPSMRSRFPRNAPTLETTAEQVSSTVAGTTRAGAPTVALEIKRLTEVHP